MTRLKNSTIKRVGQTHMMEQYISASPYPVIVCGDFNIYKSSESAYQKLILVNPANEGHVIDPLPLSGTWNNPSKETYTRIKKSLLSWDGSW